MGGMEKAKDENERIYGKERVKLWNDWSIQIKYDTDAEDMRATFTPTALFCWGSHLQRIYQFQKRINTNLARKFITQYSQIIVCSCSKPIIIINRSSGFLAFTRTSEENNKPSFWRWRSFILYLGFYIAFVNFDSCLYLFSLNKYMLNKVKRYWNRLQFRLYKCLSIIPKQI